MQVTLSMPTDDQLCERCQAIPWTDFYSCDMSWNEHRSHKVLIEETFLELAQSSCRICRLLATVKQSAHHRWLGHTAPGSSDNVARRRVGFFPDWNSYLAQEEPGLDLLEFTEGQFLRDWIPSRIDFDLVRSWITECDSSHQPGCTPAESTSIQGLHVIDCDNQVVQPAPDECSYLALSYVWGTDPCADPPTYPSLPPSLPRTIRDAITVTKRLGFQYLWIDRYCINQLDSGAKHLQIQQMGQIYASAQCTLIASVGDNPEHGLPGVSYARQDSFEDNLERIGHLVLLRLVEPSAIIKTSPWASRAWTFQEGYLSKRRLIFTDSRLICYCNQETHYDVYDPVDLGLHVDFLPTQDLARSIDQSKPSAFSRIRKSLKHYSSRHLTHSSDALNGIIGILNNLSKDHPVYHIWGVPVGSSDGWTGVYNVELLWSHRVPGKRRSGFPSWSSLGWEGAIGYISFGPCLPSANMAIQVGDSKGYTDLARYVESGLARHQSGSKVAPALLKISALTFPFIMDAERTVYLRNNDNFSFRGLVDWDRELDELDFKRPFWGLILNVGDPYTVMILSWRSGYYERIGLCVVSEVLEQPPWMKVATRRTVVLG